MASPAVLEQEGCVSFTLCLQARRGTLKYLINLSGTELSRRRRVGTYINHTRRKRETVGVPAWVAGAWVPQVGGFQKCYKQLGRRNQWAPSPLSGLSGVLLSLGQVHAQEGGSHHPHGNQSARYRPRPLGWVSPSTHQPHLPRECLLEGKQREWGALGRNSTHRIHRNV